MAPILLRDQRTEHIDQVSGAAVGIQILDDLQKNGVYRKHKVIDVCVAFDAAIMARDHAAAAIWADSVNGTLAVG